MSIWINEAVLRAASLVLHADELAVYLYIKTVLQAGEKAPSKKDLEEVIQGSGAALRRLKTDKLLAKGRIDLGLIDAAIREAAATGTRRPRGKHSNPEIADAARVLTATLKVAIGRAVPQTWWGKNYGLAYYLLETKSVELQTAVDAIAWIFTQPYLAPHCDSMWKVRDYYVRYLMAQGKSVVQKKHNHDALRSA